MALIVEDGTIVAGANSFISLADARVMATDLGLVLDADNTIAETQLRQGYYQLIRSYQKRLQGSIVSQEQTGIFPRFNVYANGFLVPSSSIPVDVQRAQVTYSDAINKGADMNATKDSQELASFNVDGVYSETYKDGSNKRATPSVPGVDQWLQPYMQSMGLTRDNFFYDNNCRSI
jgi:hypothetical protein